MKVRRDISSIPLRSAEETWKSIVDLVTGEGTVDRDQLDAAASILASLITDEAFKDHPLTMTGVSHRLVIYLLHGAEAMEAGADIDKLAWNPTAGDWRLHVPCREEDFDWAKRILACRAPRMVVIKPGDSVAAEDEDTKSTKAESLTVNWEALGE